MYQWIKNLIVFFPLFFSENLFEREPLIHSALTFVVFCFLSSIGYIINDLADVEKDRLHPVKSKRPIASGAVSKTAALSITMVLLLMSIAGSLFLQLNVIGALAVYFILNIMYSFFLKQFSLFDIFMIG